LSVCHGGVTLTSIGVCNAHPRSKRACDLGLSRTTLRTGANFG
jgi:hypothetical protein